MNTWEELRKLIEKCLGETVKAGKITAGEINAIYQLVDVVKDLDEIIMNDGQSNDGGSYRAYRESYPRGTGGSYRSNEGRNSYARRRDSMGRFMDSGYSGHEELREKMERLMDEAGSEQERETIRRCMEMI